MESGIRWAWSLDVFGDDGGLRVQGDETWGLESEIWVVKPRAWSLELGVMKPGAWSLEFGVMKPWG